MNFFARRPFRLALTLSVMLHLAALTSPGWQLPQLDEDDSATLEATLVVPVQVRPLPKIAPPPARKPARPQPAKADSPPMASADTLAMPAPGSMMEPVASTAESTLPESSGPEAVPPAPTFPYAQNWPSSGRIVFQVTRGEGGLIVGQGEHRWSHDDLRYELHAVTETTGLAALFRPAQVTLTSRGTFVATGLQPLEFKSERDGKPKDSVRFDAAQGESLPVQDMLSLFYQLGAASFNVPEFALRVQTGRKIANFLVVVGQMFKLDSPLGERNTYHLKIAAGADGDSTEIWLDALTRLPLKIRHRDRKGEVFDQVATTIQLETPE